MTHYGWIEAEETIAQPKSQFKNENRCVALMFLPKPRYAKDKDGKQYVSYKVRCRNHRAENCEYCWAHKARGVPTDALGNEMRI